MVASESAQQVMLWVYLSRQKYLFTYKYIASLAEHSYTLCNQSQTFKLYSYTFDWQLKLFANNVTRWICLKYIHIYCANQGTIVLSSGKHARVNIHKTHSTWQNCSGLYLYKPLVTTFLQYIFLVTLRGWFSVCVTSYFPTLHLDM